MSTFIELDIQILRFVNLHLADPLLTKLMLFITDKHNWFPVIGVFLVSLLIAGRKLPHPGNFFQRVNPRVFILGLIIAVVLADQTGGFLKDAVDRTRPNRDEELSRVLNCPLHTAGRRSFPSNHAANSAAVAVFTSLVYPPLTVPAFFLAGLIGFSRVYLAVHYPSDVMAGWVIGSFTGFAVWMVLRRKLKGLGISGFANMFRFRQYQSTGFPGGDWVRREWFTLDGRKVTGYLLPGSERLTVFIHGMGGSALSRTTLGEKLRRVNGCSFLLVPLRGSDGHPAKLTSGGIDEVHDILGALRFSAAEGYSLRDTVVYGTSMGGASAIKACALAGDLLPSGLIVHGAYLSFFLSARHRTGRLGAGLLKLLMPASAVRNLIRFDPVYWLSHWRTGCAVDYIYGDGDRVSPPEDGRIMAERTFSSCCFFEILPGRGHPTGKNTSDDRFVELLNRSLARIKLERKGDCL